MKTIKQVNDRIITLTSQLRTERAKDSGAYRPGTVKRISKELAFLRTVRLYLDTKPNQKAVNSQFVRLGREIAILNSRYDRWCIDTKRTQPNLTAPLLKSKYREDFNLRQLNGQFRFLQYILTDD